MWLWCDGGSGGASVEAGDREGEQRECDCYGRYGLGVAMSSKKLKFA